MKPLRIVLPGLAVLLASLAFAAESRPNILLIITDQQHAGMLSCAGNSHLKTPNLDNLARTGARFDRAYCGNPVCVPSRFCMMSGTMPSRIGMETNGEIGAEVPQEILHDAMGTVFRRAGYQTVYGGKTHVPGHGKKGRIESYGFDSITTDSRDELAVTCAKFLREKHERPFLLVASFINPHDICYMAIRAWKNSGTAPKGARITPLSPPAIQYLDAALQLPAGVSEEEFFRSVCPPLPANHGIPDGELSVFGDKQAGFRGYVRQHWTDRDWRLHRWAYARLTERVDAEIGRVLTALRESGLEKNTLVIFTSDHGDLDAAHRFEHKSLLYEEAVHVPMIVSWKGVTQAGLVDRDHLVSTGLDLIPTLCDFAGVPKPAALKGRSVKSLAEGKPDGHWRNHLVVETQQARLVLAERWKYMVGASGEIREMITDLARDAGEMKNLAPDPAYRERLETGRRLLKEWYESHDLKLDPKYVVSRQDEKK
ncbi:MAG: sulfatase-like hydrolase/transferase [Verrucomicrobia bacterium]|nr:sulfatase-like hydrolase/transferase [Verrucomicrobiota bacterium]